jgi:response regulator of citrate/malate metabolism
MIDVLVVDDDFMVAEVHAKFVNGTPGFHTVGVARTGADALRMVDELQPQLILLDVHLPDISGLEVLGRLRAGKHLVGVFVVTAESDMDAVREALHGGALQYLVKPFTQEELRSRLDHVKSTLDRLTSGRADQQQIDRAFGVPPAATHTEPLPKGLSAETIVLVRDIVADTAEVSASECGEAVGISRVSARRYLEHLVAKGEVEVRLKYGTAGRPERRYRATTG